MTFIDMTNATTRRKVQLLALRSRLKLQLRGMTSRHSNIRYAEQFGYTGPRSAKAALAWVEQELTELEGGEG